MSESPEHGVPTRLARPMAEIREALKDVIDPELGATSSIWAWCTGCASANAGYWKST